MALTRPEIMEHIGEMMDHGFSSLGTDSGVIELCGLISWAKDYRENGSLGTQAERAEAMKAAMKKLYRKTCGRDPDANATNLHQMRHWIEDREFGDGDAYE